MRVCEVSQYGLSQVSGVSTVIRSLAAWLARRGWPVAIVGPELTTPRPQEGVEYWPIHVREPFRDVSLAMRTLLQLWERRRDWNLLHLHQAHLQTASAAVLGRLLGRPVVSTLHAYPRVAGRLRRILQAMATRIVLALSTDRVFVSEFTRSCFKADGEVVRNGVDLERFAMNDTDRTLVRAALGLEGFVVVFTGRRTVDKGYLDLVAAVRQVRDAGVDMRLLSAGAKPASSRPNLGRAVDGVQSDPWIRDVGESEEIPRLLAAADALALPSYSEGLPMSLLEALAAGLPVVASRVGGIPEVISDGTEGFLIAPGEIGELRDRLKRLASESGLRASMAAKARETAKAFTLNAAGEAYLRIFEIAAKLSPRTDIQPDRD